MVGRAKLTPLKRDPTQPLWMPTLVSRHMALMEAWKLNRRPPVSALLRKPKRAIDGTASTSRARKGSDAHRQRWATRPPPGGPESASRSHSLCQCVFDLGREWVGANMPISLHRAARLDFSHSCLHKRKPSLYTSLRRTTRDALTPS
jgi:hypothetical protein